MENPLDLEAIEHNLFSSVLGDTRKIGARFCLDASSRCSSDYSIGRSGKIKPSIPNCLAFLMNFPNPAFNRIFE